MALIVFQNSSRILQKIPKPSVHQTEIHIWKVEKKIISALYLILS